MWPLVDLMCFRVLQKALLVGETFAADLTLMFLLVRLTFVLVQSLLRVELFRTFVTRQLWLWLGPPHAVNVDFHRSSVHLKEFAELLSGVQVICQAYILTAVYLLNLEHY